MRAAFVTVALLAGVALRLAAQEDVATRLDRRVAPEVVREVEALAASAVARGLPVEPLIQKAIEGGAKGVPAERVIAAVRTLAARLEMAAGALRSSGIASPAADMIEGGADALGAGLSANQVGVLARSSRQPHDPGLTLRVAATIAALGVPPKTALELVRDMIKAGRAPSDILSLPAQVQAVMARGATPAQAAEGLGRAAAHQPPGRSPDRIPPGQAKPKPHKP